ncbi:hypothetical protein [Chryseobacterium indoltheticum]
MVLAVFGVTGLPASVGAVNPKVMFFVAAGSISTKATSGTEIVTV